MSTPDERPDTITPDEHARLCAWLLGELEEDEARAVEAALERSPALRAERARLAATIGLVRSTLPAEELPEASFARVAEAARRHGGGDPYAVPAPYPARPRWSLLRGGNAPLLRAAAVLVGVLLGGTLAWRALPWEGATGERDEVARAERLEADLPRVVGYADDREGSAGAAPRARKGDELEGASPARADAAAASQALEETVAAAPDPDGISAAASESRMQKNVAAPGALAASEAAKAEPARDVVLRELGPDPRGRASGEEEAAGSASADAPADELFDEVEEDGLGSVGQRGGDREAPEGLRALGVLDASEPKAGPPAEPAGEAAESGQVGLGTAGGAGGRFGGRRSRSAPLAPGRPGATRPGASAPELARPVDTLLPGSGRRLLPEAGSADGDVDPTSYTVVGNERPERRRPEGSEGMFMARGVRSQPEPPASEEEIARRAERLVAACRPRPGESPGAMFFRYWGDNPFEEAVLDPLSTFSVDVDTASYALARAYLRKGYVPRKEQIRTEEFLNWFRADVPPPPPEETFRVALEMAPSLFGGRPDAWMLRVVVRGQDVAPEERQPVALTFVLDVSGSMEGERLALVKQALLLLVRQLSTTDSVALVTFQSEARLVAPMASAANRVAFEEVVLGLEAGGSTNAEAGLRLGYELAAAARTPHAVNRVVLLSDGVANVGETDQRRILERVAEHRAHGIYLNAIGVGMGNHHDAFLEQLADRGDGVCNYVDSLTEARRVLVDGLTKALQPIARDVKVQVELDPDQVESYRLLGYENRAVADRDFRNDAVDAGEVNAGHQVTALYEIVRRGPGDGPPATVRLRWKPPFALDGGDTDEAARAAAERAVEIERALEPADVVPSFREASWGYRRSVLVAQLAEVLRRSVHARGDSASILWQQAQRLARGNDDPELDELAELVGLALPLVERWRAEREDDELGRMVDELCRLHWEAARRALLEDEDEPEHAERLRTLERRIHELLRRR